ncbi:serine/threonine-protein kinase [Modestobacter caceresii]|uniref:serine/threonine-protein kinase n=1 Tax=Modestobacter caceresii TaxID=1522368 RepID=UPI0018CD9301|nr:serine/threonine-protein kinase [Modestobacter caceresii]
MANVDPVSLGDFRLLQLLGKGASGRVYRAVHTRDGTIHAVKVLRDDLDDPTAIVRFEREAQALVGLEHPALVRVERFLVHEDRAAIVMELVHGPNLREHLNERGPLPPAVSCKIAAQVGRGLAAAHAAGVVHRDLKPENVLLEPGEREIRAKVSDFGVARLINAATVTRTKHVVGTPAYMAPECAAGVPVTSAVDVYALGVVLFEMVVGWRPFRGDTLMAVLRQHEAAPRRQPAGIPDPLWAVLDQALAVQPQARPDAAALAGQLEQLSATLAGLPAAPVTDPPPPEVITPASQMLTEVARVGEPPPAKKQRSGRRRAAAAGAAALTLAGSAGLAVLVAHGQAGEAATSQRAGSTPPSVARTSELPATASEPTVSEPAAIEPTPVNPSPEEQIAPQASAGPEPPGPTGLVEPEPTGPTGLVEPEPTRPAEPEPTRPAEPEPTGPTGPAEPEPTGPAEPEPTGPTGPAEPEPTGPAEPEPTGSQPESSATQPYTAEQICGSGFSVAYYFTLPLSVNYFLWNSGMGQACVVTLKVADVGQSTPIAAFIQLDGSDRISDSGLYQYYAGPIFANVLGCVTWGGSDASMSYETPPDAYCNN